MTDRLTLDTNIIVYAFGKQDDFRKPIAKEIITKCHILSLHVVNETVYVLIVQYYILKICSITRSSKVNYK